MHQIDDFGTAEFIAKPGPSLFFVLSSDRSKKFSESIVVKQLPPPWKHESAENLLLSLMPKTRKFPITIEKESSVLLMDVLREGFSVGFKYQDLSGSNSEIDVSLNPVGFQTAYREFEKCKSNLIKHSIDDLRYTELNYATNTSILTDDMKHKIDNIVEYVSAVDGRVQIEISGHTDSVSHRMYNAKLSQRRAQHVADYMVAKGVSSTVLTTHAYGERRPKKSNSTSAGRTTNRRVEIVVTLRPD